MQDSMFIGSKGGIPIWTFWQIDSKLARVTDASQLQESRTMDGAFKQIERLGRLTTELGEDVLVLLRFDGTDYLNELFEYRV
ncbi:hypothetical protein, partial [Paracoccus alkanivorans]